MNVNEIYNIKKILVCLQCRKDKGILDVMRQPAICNVAAIYSLVGVVGWLVTVTSPYRYRVQFKNIIYYENG